MKNRFDETVHSFDSFDRNRFYFAVLLFLLGKSNFANCCFGEIIWPPTKLCLNGYHVNHYGIFTLLFMALYASIPNRIQSKEKWKQKQKKNKATSLLTGWAWAIIQSVREAFFVMYLIIHNRYAPGCLFRLFYFRFFLFYFIAFYLILLSFEDAICDC